MSLRMVTCQRLMEFREGATTDCCTCTGSEEDEVSENPRMSVWVEKPSRLLRLKRRACEIDDSGSAKRARLMDFERTPRLGRQGPPSFFDEKKAGTKARRRIQVQAKRRTRKREFKGDCPPIVKRSRQNRNLSGVNQMPEQEAGSLALVPVIDSRPYMGPEVYCDVGIPVGTKLVPQIDEKSFGQRFSARDTKVWRNACKVTAGRKRNNECRALVVYQSPQEWMNPREVQAREPEEGQPKKDYHAYMSEENYEEIEILDPAPGIPMTGRLVGGFNNVGFDQGEPGDEEAEMELE